MPLIYESNYWIKHTADEIPEREKILQPYLESEPLNHWGWGGCRRFQKVPIEVVELLIKKGYLKIRERQNNSPTVGQFMRFMNKWHRYNITAHGYEVSASRPDCRISIEGLAIERVPDNDVFKNDWMEFNQNADDLNENYSWWD